MGPTIDEFIGQLMVDEKPLLPWQKIYVRRILQSTEEERLLVGLRPSGKERRKIWK